MALWDAVSGKIYRWNDTKHKAGIRVCNGLDRFTRRKVDEAPNFRHALMSLQCKLYSYWFATHYTLSQAVAQENFEYKAAIYKLNEYGLRNLVASCHAAHIACTYAAEEHHMVLGLMLEGIGSMYAKPDAYLESWAQCALNGDGAFLAYKRYDEVSMILGLPQSHPGHMLKWAEFSLSFAQGAARLGNDPRWEAVVPDEIAAAVAAA